MTETPEILLAQVTPSLEAAISLFDFDKAAVFTVLKVAGITQIVVSFDGCGDSGQVEDISATHGNEPVPMPDGMIERLDVI